MTFEGHSNGEKRRPPQNKLLSFFDSIKTENKNQLSAASTRYNFDFKADQPFPSLVSQPEIAKEVKESRNSNH